MRLPMPASRLSAREPREGTEVLTRPPSCERVARVEVLERQRSGGR
jgi:hypothetical protein